MFIFPLIILITNFLLVEQLVLRCAGAPVCEKLQFTVLLASAVNHIAFPAYGMTVMGVYLLFLHHALRPVLSFFFFYKTEGIQTSLWFLWGQEVRDNSQHRTRILLRASLQITSWVSCGSQIGWGVSRTTKRDSIRDLQEVFP